MIRLRKPALVLNRWADRYVYASIDREKRYVTRGHDYEPVIWRGVAWRFLLGCACLFALQWWSGTAWAWLPSLVLGGVIGQWSCTWTGKSSAYRSGWLDGRRRMIEQTQNHDHPLDWLQTELDHDAVHVLGIPPRER